MNALITIIYGPIEETKLLNKLSKSFRSCSFFKRNSIIEGFEINPHDGVWEYQIKNYKSLIVFKEINGNNLEMWAYLNGDKDIQPYIHSIVKLTSDERKNNHKFCTLIESVTTKLLTIKK